MHAVFQCDSQKPNTGGIFWQLFCKKKIYVSVCVRVEVKLLLTAEKKIYARGDNWFPMISGNGIWLAESEADAWSHSICWVHYEKIREEKRREEKRREEKRREEKRREEKRREEKRREESVQRRWNRMRQDKTKWQEMWIDRERQERVETTT